jgi:hypothetical protein
MIGTMRVLLSTNRNGKVIHRCDCIEMLVTKDPLPLLKHLFPYHCCLLELALIP